jgi:hypothetical protein
MKTILLVLILAATQDTQRSDCTALAATQGAMVTLEKVPAPAPSPTPAPDGAAIGGPIDTYHDAKTLIDKGNALADRGKSLLDQAQRDGKITVDIRLPLVPGTDALVAYPPGRTCRSGRCPLRSADPTPPAGNPQTQANPSEACAGGVCPTCPSAAQTPPASTSAAEATAQHSSGAYRVRRVWRWRR